LLIVLIVLAHALGFATSFPALMATRTPQGTLAWLLALNTLPYVAVPAYWVFGQRRFAGYLVSRRDADSRLREVLDEKVRSTDPLRADLADDPRGGIRAVEALAALPVLGGNEVELLVDGKAIFRSLFAGIERAREYILVQFYIVKDDEIGQELKRRLITRADEGVRVHFLYDEVGSYRLSSRYLEEMTEAGIEVSRFHSFQGRGNRFQLNFRNHRKVLVVDGEEGWVGGINVGDEYLGKDPDLGALRETHLRVRGPAALSLQLSFMEDWQWATDRIPDLNWTPAPSRSGEGVPVLILPSGPADPMETASLLIQHAIHSVQERVWISSPYFVPDGGVMAALKLAALRGVDVRILIPEKADHLLVELAGFSFLGDLLEAGVSFHRYQRGFLHAKAMLLDDIAAAVGTVNLDNRSFRLNFEITALVLDREFAGEVKEMFEDDFAQARAVSAEEVRSSPFLYRAAARAASLFAPIL